MKLVALGMSAEVIMIFENQNAGVLSGLLTKKVCGRQTADAAATFKEESTSRAKILRRLSRGVAILALRTPGSAYGARSANRPKPTIPLASS